VVKHWWNAVPVGAVAIVFLVVLVVRVLSDDHLMMPPWFLRIHVKLHAGSQPDVYVNGVNN